MPTSINSLLSRMSDPAKQDIDRKCVTMLYGPPGGGKTVLAMGLAQALRTELGQIVYVDSAEGWVSLENHEGLMDNYRRLAYEDKGDLFALAEACKRKSKGFEKVEVVVIDELSSIANDILDSVVRERSGTPRGDALPEVEGKDYRPMGDTVRAAIVAFQKAGVHLIIVAHDKSKTDFRKVTNYFPNLSPMLRQDIQGLMHVTGRVTAEISGTAAKPVYKRTVQAAPSALVEAKTRVGALREATKISFPDFVDAITDWVNGSTMADDLVANEDHSLVPDELPTDGIPVSEEAETDDEPVYAGSDDDDE